MTVRTLALCAALAVLSMAQAETAGTSLTVTIHGVKAEPSKLFVGVYESATYDEGPPSARQLIDAASPSTIVTFDGLTPGRFAVKVLQDINGNGKMDTTMIGIPEEPFGLSNDIKPSMSAPGFDETGFDLQPGPNAISITLQEM